MPINQRMLIGGIAVGGAGIAFYLYRKNKKAEAASAATAAASQQVAYGYGFGYGYGGAYAYGLTYEPYGYGFGDAGLGAYGGASGNYGYGYYGAGVPVQTQVPTQATTNAQWSEAAMSALSSAGYDPMTTLAALGQYLLGGNLSPAQVPIVTAAIGAEGYPPQEGANGYPPQMKTGGTTGGGQGGGTTSAQYASNPPTNLHLVRNGRTGVQIQWNAVQGAKKYNVHTPGRTPTDFTTTNTIANIGSLKPNTSYTVEVWADPTPTGGPHATLRFKTTA